MAEWCRGVPPHPSHVFDQWPPAPAAVGPVSFQAPAARCDGAGTQVEVPAVEQEAPPLQTQLGAEQDRWVPPPESNENMESQVITPGPGQSVIATETDRRWGHGHGHSREWETTILREELANFRDATRQREDTKNAVFSVSKDVQNAAKDAAVGFKDGLVTAYQVEGRGLLEAAKNAAALGVQAEKLAAASILDATKNAAALAAQIAACCCELKEKIGADGDATRALINANQMQDLRDRATKSESLLAAYFARGVVPVTP